MNKKLGYLLLAVGVFPILVAIFAVMEGITAILLSVMFANLGITTLKTFIAIGFFVSLLTGVYLLKKR